MSSQKAAASEFFGCFLLIIISGLLPQLKVEGLDFAAGLSLGYGLLLTAFRDMKMNSLNPALTAANILRGSLEVASGCLIILAQFAGAAVGALLLCAVLHQSNVFPALAHSTQSSQAMLTQLTFGAALVFAYLRGAGRNKYDGLWLAALMYGSFVVGGSPTMYLNPAMALATGISRGVSGVSLDETLLAVLVLMPLVAAGVGFLLYKSADHNLQMSELVGTFFLSFGILAAALKGGFPIAVGFAFYAAAIIRMVAPVSGGSLNPAVVAGAVLSEGHSISKDVATVFLFQLGGATLAALLANQALGGLPSSAALVSGNGEVLLVALVVSAFLIFSYCIDFGDFFGSPAAAIIGAVYGASIVAGKSGVPINPATSLGATFASMIKTGTAPDALESAAGVFVPVLGCMAGAALLRLLPLEYRRRL